jgi:Zn-dependent peptidase ImmA (M78 family)
MLLLYHKATSLEIGWNERTLTECDLYRLCRRFDIRVDELPLETSGFYYRLMGRDAIAVNSRLDPRRRLFVLFHEFAHFLLHAPESGPAANFHGVGRRSRAEVEADAFALCAMLPRPALRDPSEIPYDSLPIGMVQSRIGLLRIYGI